MMARGRKRLQAKVGYIDARPHTSPTRRSLLATHGRTIHLGQKRTKRHLGAMSALCQKRTNAPQQNFLFDHRAERSGAHRTKNRRLCGARAKPPAEVAGPKSYSADLV